MNPQGHNAQQNNPPPHAAPPAGRWDEGADLNNAPAPATVSSPGRQWRQRCADHGYIAGDELVQPYIQHRPLLDEEGQMNTGGIYGFVGTADSIGPANARGIAIPLAELAALMQARNWTMDAVEQAMTALEEGVRAEQNAAQAVMHGKETGASHAVLVSLQATLDQCGSEVEALRSTLATERSALRKLQEQIASAQGLVLKMIHGEQPVGTMVGPAQGGVQLIPDPTAMTPLLRLVQRHPMTTITLVVTILSVLSIALLDSLHPSGSPNDAEQNREILSALSLVACLFLTFNFILERMFGGDNAG